ncbi:hypothetical protein POM88_015903 [Heracleum sosnowskyi]|uniref:Thioredoxin-like fold domain-containing protein n=1 Tax=Heracleum sosnowskyi TaxID=360622 RepID=A0AAD8IL42_9APIA|nr:hypothetical protein POM88_015903 [Heracleum sosnowskyi]
MKYMNKFTDTIAIATVVGREGNSPDHQLRPLNDRSVIKEVKAEQLADKVVVVYFLLLPLSHNSAFDERWDITVLENVYNYLYLPPDKGFEVVFVAVDDNDTSYNNEKSLHPYTETNLENHFQDVFSCMPWPAIPFYDITSREYLQRTFGFMDCLSNFSAIVIDSTGMVLQKQAHWCFNYFGTLGYPFSHERENFLESECKAIAMQPSLSKLLSSPERDYLITNNEEKVPIHTLEDKVTAGDQGTLGQTNVAPK